ncbi:MAG: hypothetical protein R3345_08755 [Fulvivirga sp.]|nr:hypothetical protein [Fulvivirga sp.]
MKKLLTLLLVAGFMFGFVACGGNQSADESESTEVVEEAGDEMEEATEEVEDAAEDVADEAEEAAEEVEEEVEEDTTATE